MSRKGHKIRAVDPGSIAEALELEPGDCEKITTDELPLKVIEVTLAKDRKSVV